MFKNKKIYKVVFLIESLTLFFPSKSYKTFFLYEFSSLKEALNEIDKQLDELNSSLILRSVSLYDITEVKDK